jgi:hypothetical protein
LEADTSQKEAKNNERPETLSSPGRPGSPPPELLTIELNRVTFSCVWHFRAIPTPEVLPSHLPEKSNLRVILP